MADENKVHLLVNIPVAGDGFPNEQELNARNKVIDELDRRKFGHFVGAGGGMGAMDFSYVVTDEQQGPPDRCRSDEAVPAGQRVFDRSRFGRRH